MGPARREPIRRRPDHEAAAATTGEEFAELVLDVVEQIPPGRVMTYGDIAELLGRGGPRRVGAVMSRHGAGVPWWRVVRADGRPAQGLESTALERLAAEDCPLTADRVDLRRARVDETTVASRARPANGPGREL